MPPTKNARPMTSSRLPRIEPMSADWTTVMRPALSANRAMNSSGRFPSADCSAPVAPGPKRSPSCSTDRPTSEASTATAPAEATNGTTVPAGIACVMPAAEASPTLNPITTRSARVNIRPYRRGDAVSLMRESWHVRGAIPGKSRARPVRALAVNVPRWKTVAMDLGIGWPVSPMLATAVPEVPDPDAKGGPYAYEPKWDGFRCIVARDGDEVELGSRGEKPLTRYFPEVVEAVRRLLPERIVVDVELVVRAGERGTQRLDGEALAQRIHPAESRIKRLAAETPAEIVAFDLLALSLIHISEPTRPY